MDPFAPTFPLLGDSLNTSLEELNLPTIQDPFKILIKSSDIKFRHNGEVPPPELHRPGRQAKWLLDDDDRVMTRKLKLRRPKMSLASTLLQERGAVIGGAVVKNICLVLPNSETKVTGYGDLPVMPVQVSKKNVAKLYSHISDKLESAPMPLLVLPEELTAPPGFKDEVARAKDMVQGGVGYAKEAVKSMLAPETGDESLVLDDDEDKSAGIGEAETGKTELGTYVVSGDIDDFWGVKGLTAKLYKYKGPEEKAKPGDIEGSGKNNDDDVIDKKAKTDTDGEGKQDTDEGEKKDGEDEDSDGPVREKIILNPQSFAWNGSPLGQLLPFIDNEEIKSLPIANLELTYSTETSENPLYQPGLRLEVDVVLKDKLQWAGDAVKTMFAPDVVPTIHLSACLAEERNWSERPKVNKLMLHGYFRNLVWKPWNIVHFKTVGIEMIAENISTGDDEEDKKDGDDEEKKEEEGEDKKDDEENKGGEDGNEAELEISKKSGRRQRKTKKQSRREEQIIRKKQEEVAKRLKEEGGEAAAEVENLELDKKTDDDKKGEEETKDGEQDAKEGEGKETDGKEDGKEVEKKKKKKKGKWIFSFGFIGEASIINIPEAKAPLDMYYRIARDSVDEKKRFWNMVIKAGKWENIFGYPDLSMDEAEFKASFDDEDFGSSIKLTISGKMKLGGGTFEVDGQFLKGIRHTKKTKKGKIKFGESKGSKDGEQTDDKTTKTKLSEKEAETTDDKKDQTDGKAEGDAKEGKDGDEEKDKKDEDKEEEDEDSEEILVRDHFIKAEVGDLTLTDINKIHAQLTGQAPTTTDEVKDSKTEGAETKAEDHEVTFKKLSFKLSHQKWAENKKPPRTALELEGHATFEKVSSAKASVTFASEGVTVVGEVADVTIPDTSILLKKAGLKIFVAFNSGKDPKRNETKKTDKKRILAGEKNSDAKEGDKDNTTEAEEKKTEDEKSVKKDEDSTVAKTEDEQAEKSKDGKTDKPKKPKRESSFDILGEIHWEKIIFRAGFHTARKKDKAAREWLAFGSAGSVRLRELWPDIPEDSFLNLQLDNVAIIASSENRKQKRKDKKKKGDEEDEEEKKEDDKIEEEKEKGDEKTDNEKKKDEKRDKDVVGNDKAKLLGLDKVDVGEGGEVWDRDTSVVKATEALDQKAGDKEKKKKKKGKRFTLTVTKGGKKLVAGKGKKGREEVTGTEEKKEDGEKEEVQEEEAEDEEGDGEDDDDTKADEKELESWDVLGRVDSYNYPIVRGFQICATISSFEQLEELNGKRKIEGLMLTLSVSMQGKISVGIDLPASFRVDLSDVAFLSDFGTSVRMGTTGPELELRATLTIMMEDSDPLRIKGVLVGSFTDAQASIIMDSESRWINPFNLNKQLVLSDLAFQFGFMYATVLVQGPTNVFLRGAAQIGSFRGRIDMGFDMKRAAAVFQVEISELDIMDLVLMTFTLTPDPQIQAALTAGVRGLVTFKDIKVYLSSGCEFCDVYYDRGVQIRGSINLFDTIKGDFDGSFTDDGVKIMGGLDAFQIGGLEITSLKEYNGKKRATVQFELLKSTEQAKLLLDGIIRFYGIEFQVYIDADLQKRNLIVDILFKIGEDFSFMLKADVKVPEGQQSLEGVEAHFEGELNVNFVKALADLVVGGIDKLEAAADQAIEYIEEKIQDELEEKRNQVAALKTHLDEAKAQQAVAKQAKYARINEENDWLLKVQDEYLSADEAYQRILRESNATADEVRNQERRRDDAQRALEDAKADMARQYEDDLAREQASQEMWEAEQHRLEQQKEASWGDILRSGEAADISWQWWEGVEREQDQWKHHCVERLLRCHWTEKLYWAIKLGEANAGLEITHARKAVDAEARHAAKAVASSREFRQMEHSINEAAEDVARFGRAIDKLVTQGVVGYMEEMTTDRHAELQLEIEKLQMLIAKSMELSAELQRAREMMLAKEATLSRETLETRKRVADLEGEIKTLPLEIDYVNKRDRFTKLEAEVQLLVSRLEAVREGIDDLAEDLRQAVRLVEKGIPKITRVKVKGSTESFKEGSEDPLIFEMDCEWLDWKTTVHLEWDPDVDLADLAKQAIDEVLGLTEAKEFKKLPEVEPRPAENGGEKEKEKEKAEPVVKAPKKEEKTTSSYDKYYRDTYGGGYTGIGHKSGYGGMRYEKGGWY